MTICGGLRLYRGLSGIGVGVLEDEALRVAIEEYYGRVRRFNAFVALATATVPLNEAVLVEATQRCERSGKLKTDSGRIWGFSPD